MLWNKIADAGFCISPGAVETGNLTRLLRLLRQNILIGRIRHWSHGAMVNVSEDEWCRDNNV